MNNEPTIWGWFIEPINMMTWGRSQPRIIQLRSSNWAERQKREMCWVMNHLKRLKTQMEVSINGGTPKWMNYSGMFYWNAWFGGTPILGNHQIYPNMSATLKSRMWSLIDCLCLIQLPGSQLFHPFGVCYVVDEEVKNHGTNSCTDPWCLSWTIDNVVLVSFVDRNRIPSFVENHKLYTHTPTPFGNYRWNLPFWGVVES